MCYKLFCRFSAIYAASVVSASPSAAPEADGSRRIFYIELFDANVLCSVFSFHFVSSPLLEHFGWNGDDIAAHSFACDKWHDGKRSFMSHCARILATRFRHKLCFSIRFWWHCRLRREKQIVFSLFCQFCSRCVGNSRSLQFSVCQCVARSQRCVTLDAFFRFTNLFIVAISFIRH